MILSCSNISKAFGTNEVIKRASFHIEENEKAAIVGINGAGKSTLLKIIIGELPADEGEVVTQRVKPSVTYHSIRTYSGERTVYEEVLEVKRPIMEMEAKIRKMEMDMKHAYR